MADLADALHEYAKDLGEVRTLTLVENNLAIMRLLNKTSW